MSSIDDIVGQIVEEAERALSLRRVILFGSQARGDARADSDIDLAFEHDSDDAKWAAFVNQMADEAPTLLSLDLVDLSHVSATLSEAIRRDGLIVHG